MSPNKSGLNSNDNGMPGVGESFDTANEAVAELERMLGKRSALWSYVNAEGEPVGVVVRWDRNGEKDIRPVSRHGDGWRIGALPQPRPLCRLSDLPGAPIVIVTDDENAAEKAKALGFVATTSAGGLGEAGKTDWQPLGGKEVWIIPDKNGPGSKYAETVANILSKLMPAPVIRIVVLPDKGGIVDWIEAHGDAAEPDGMRAEIESLAKAAPVWKPATKPEPGPVMTCLADVEPRPVSWLWPGRIPLGRITLLVGRPGEGKSYLTIDAVSRISTGTPWPDGHDCPKGSAILISAEDDPADTIRPRLDAHSADVRHIHLLSAVRRVDDKGAIERMITLADVDAIELALQRIPDCKLIIVDPIGSFLGGQTDAHRDNEVRSVLAPIAALAEKYGPAVLVVAHRRKTAGSTADDTALGSRAFTGIARAVWHLARDPEDKARRLLLPGKNNLAREGEGLAFSITGDPAHIVWERDPVDMTADDALAEVGHGREQKPGPEADALEAAIAWLRSSLADGPRRAKELLDEWTNGQGGSKRTLCRAKQSLHVDAYRHEVPGPWWWRLPGNIATEPNSGDVGNLGNLAEKSDNREKPDTNISMDANRKNPGALAADQTGISLPTGEPSVLFDTETPFGPYRDGF